MAVINPPGIPIERGKIHEYANSIMDDNPLYHDEEAAKAAGLPSVVAPPTYTAVQNYFAKPGEGMMELCQKFDLDLRYVLHGGREFFFERPIFAGDQLIKTEGEINVFTKEGKRGGAMKFVEINTEFTDQKGEVVLRVKDTVIQTGGVVK